MKTFAKSKYTDITIKKFVAHKRDINQTPVAF